LNQYRTLFKNYELDEGTFLYELVEEANFNEVFFWDYYNEVIHIAKEHLNKPLDKELTNIVFWTYKRILESFLYHYMPFDVYKISNLPEGKINCFLERLSCLIEGYFGDFVIEESRYGDEIKNPKFPQLYKEYT